MKNLCLSTNCKIVEIQINKIDCENIWDFKKDLQTNNKDEEKNPNK